MPLAMRLEGPILKYQAKRWEAARQVAAAEAAAKVAAPSTPAAPKRRQQAKRAALAGAQR